MLAGKFLKE